MIRNLFRSTVFLGICAVFGAFVPVLGQNAASNTNIGALITLLKEKGVLSATDLSQLQQAGGSEQEAQALTAILLKKGLIAQSDLDRLAGKPDPAPVTAAANPPRLAPPAPAPAPPATRPAVVPVTWTRVSAQVPPHPTEPGAPAVVDRPPSTTINEALVPIRVFPVGGPKRGATKPAFSADGVGFTPYGFIKVTAVEDSSSPNGDDFPLPGFLSDTGPNGAPEFHLKSRSSRFGANFEWYDPNSKWVLTGKLEGDFEGNFNRSDNRNLSSIRSSNPSLRVAWGRMDYHFDNDNTFSALFGQDWTTYGSSTLPNILETTGLGIGFGALYERTPQMRVGFTHRAHAFSLMPEFSIDLPSSGLPPSAANISSQLGYGERQGPDSGRPQVEGRVVAQWNLDHAKGVPPAQIVFSGFEGRRTATVLASAIPAAYLSQFPTGVTASSNQDGWDAEWQLPTRWFTLVGKVYGGSDLRWFFAGQLYSFFNDTAGLTSLASVSSEDGSSTVVLGTNADGSKVVAPQRPVRAAGGFVQLGLPLSRIFSANPAGRNSGWTIYALYGEDQARARDIDRVGGTRHASSMTVGTLNYRFNRWVSFSWEQSLYTTHANPELPLPLFRGVHSREWNDVREEGGPIFFF
ncbi:MAG: hypothetical protein ACLGXA_14715 [Acidobacteriota bacterium]